MTIYEMRTALGDTQSEFAERYNIPFRTIQNWEAGVRKPPEYVVALLESRSVTPEQLRRMKRQLEALEQEEGPCPDEM